MNTTIKAIALTTVLLGSPMVYTMEYGFTRSQKVIEHVNSTLDALKRARSERLKKFEYGLQQPSLLRDIIKDIKKEDERDRVIMAGCFNYLAVACLLDMHGL